MGFISFPVLLVILYLFISLRVLKQYERGVVFLLGKFAGVRGPGLTMIFVPFQTMTRVSLRTVTMQVPSQKIITKDNVSIDIAAVAYYHISDPERAVIAIENVYNAISQISQTTVRNVVGRFSLDQLLSDTASINEQIKDVIDHHTEPWGTQVTAVEIKDITLPDNMQRAMAKEAEAERERRAKIVAAEGEYQAAVTWVPQGSVWRSMTFLIWSLMLAVSDNSWSRLKRRTTLRTVVWLIWLIAL